MKLCLSTGWRRKKLLLKIAEIIKKTAGYHEYEKGVLIRGARQ